MVTTSLRIAAELKNLATIRRFVEKAAAQLDADPEATADVLQAVDESATNIIVHGYRGQSGEIEVEVQQSGPALVVRLRDQAPPFDPTRVPAPDLSLPLDRRPLGGMGVYLTRHLTDEASYRLMSDGRNELTLIKEAIPNHQDKGESYESHR